MIVTAPDFSEKGGFKIANYLNLKFVVINTKKFPNGEVLAKISQPDEIKNEDIILFIHTYPNTNERIMLLLQSMEALRHYGAKQIHLVIPYLPYSRQDKRFLTGEALSLKLLTDLLEELKVDTLFTVDVHSIEVLKTYAKFDVNIISLFEPLAKKILNELCEEKANNILVAPDEGRLNPVKRLAKKLSVPYTYFTKKRDLYTGEISIKPVDERTEADYAIMIDDEISTGGTMSEIAKILKRNGVKHVIAGAIHLILTDKAIERLYQSGVDYIVGSNTIENPFSIIESEYFLAVELKKELQ